MKIHELPGDPGRRQKRKRVGRGTASGHGGTSGRGHKGQQARAGKGRDSRAHRFEGGQTPLLRRIPKRGFTNSARIEYQVVNIGQLEGFADGATVDRAALKAAGIVSVASRPVKLLSAGSLTKKLNVKVARASKAAADAVTAAGGTIEAVVGKPRAKSTPRKKAEAAEGDDAS